MLTFFSQAASLTKGLCFAKLQALWSIAAPSSSGNGRQSAATRQYPSRKPITTVRKQSVSGTWRQFTCKASAVQRNAACGAAPSISARAEAELAVCTGKQAPQKEAVNQSVEQDDSTTDQLPPASRGKRNPSRRQVLSAVLTAAGGVSVLDPTPQAEAAVSIQAVPSETVTSSWLQKTASQKGVSALRDPVLNQGLALTEAQRRSLGIEGLLPSVYEDLQKEMERALYNLDKCTSDLQKYQYLVTLKETNEDCFYALLMERTQELLPIV